MTTIYTATPEMCHPEPNYGENLLPHDWPGKAFTLQDDGLVAILDEGPRDLSRWSITQELSDKIRASAEPTAIVTLEKHKAVCAEKDDTITRLHSQIKDLGEVHQAFKRRVGEVAMEYAERHDWCPVVREALDEMGIEVPTKEYTFTLSVIYHVRGTKETYGEPDTYQLREYAFLDAGISMSADDWGDLEVEYVQHDVMDIEEVQE